MATSNYSIDHNADQGLFTDLPVQKTPNNVAVELINFHQFSASDIGEQEILQNERGNEFVTGLPPNWLVVGSAGHNGVQYLVLAEFNDNKQATGRGQIGSFPSPGPLDDNSDTDGNLEKVYRPLHNLILEGETEPGEFITDRFNFTLQPVRVEIQPDYDGTVNLILNDHGRNPPRLINTRFAVKEGGRYQLIDREGEGDTNVYEEHNFNDTLRLFQRSRALTRLRFLGLRDGGQLLGGSYQVYVQYVNQEGNETDVVAHSPRIVVFDGSHQGNAVGTLAATTRMIALQLENLDQSYYAVRVLFVHTGGEGAAEAVSAYQLAFDVPITSTTQEVTLTGFENKENITVASLSLRAERIETFRDMTQVDNRLLFCGPVESVYDRVSLDAVARATRIGYRQVDITSAGTTNDATIGQGEQSPLSTTDWNQTDRDGWKGGYLNPLNVAYRLGYPSGEALAFGIVFRLTNGTDSQVFPLHGHDELMYRGDFTTNNPADYDNRGWRASGENLDGVYRFPHLGRSGREQGTAVLTVDGRYVRVMGVTFKLPEIPQEVLAGTLGCYFVRSARKPDRLCQGVAVATVNSLLVAPNSEAFDHHHSAVQFNANNDRNNPNMKVLPAVGGVLETAVKKHNTSQRKVGPYPFMFARQAGINRYRLALYSPDAYANPEKYGPLVNGRQLRMVRFMDVNMRRSEDFTGTDGNRSWNLNKTVGFTPTTTYGQPKVQAYYTPAGQFASNDGRFGSAEKYLVGKHPNDDRYLVQSGFGDYIGLLGEFQLTNGDVAVSPPAAGGTGNEIASYTNLVSYQFPFFGGWLVNLYPRYSEDEAIANITLGARNTQVLRDVYSSSSEQYFPITPVMSWAEVEAQLDSERRFTAFGGDTYVGQSYHRTQYMLPDADVLDGSYAEGKTQQILGVCCESDCNPYLRVPEVQARPGEAVPRSFPLLAVQQAGGFNGYRAKSYRGPETEGYNAGYQRHTGHTFELAAVRGLPYRATEFPNRITPTTQHVAGAFRNGFRSLLRGASQDYAKNLGSITGIRAWRGMVGIGFENGFGIIGVNERVAGGSDSAGPVFFEAKQILPSQIALKSEEHGLFAPHTLLSADAGIFGLGSKGAWKFNEQGFESISAMMIDRLLSPLLTRITTSRGEQLLKQEARVEYDAGRGDVLFTFLSEPPRNEQDSARTVGYINADEYLLARYNVRKQRWVGGQATYKAHHQFSLLDTLYSLPVPGQARQVRPGIFTHATGSGKYYDQLFESSVTFVVLGEKVKMQKMLDNLVLTSNDVLPVRVYVAGEDSLPTTQETAGGRVAQRNAEYSEGYVYITLEPDAEGRAHRGKSIRVQLTYSSQQAVVLENVAMIIRNSYR
jgi:hypothetical protein